MDASQRFGGTRSRRRYPRLEVLGEVEGQSVPLDIQLTIRELAQGGFSTESAVPFPPGSRHHFRFTTSLDAVVSLDATAVHCRLASAGANGQHTYVTGFEFASDRETDEGVAVLIDTLTSVLSLE